MNFKLKPEKKTVDSRTCEQQYSRMNRDLMADRDNQPRPYLQSEREKERKKIIQFYINIFSSINSVGATELEFQPPNGT